MQNTIYGLQLWLSQISPPLSEYPLVRHVVWKDQYILKIYQLKKEIFANKPVTLKNYEVEKKEKRIQNASDLQDNLTF